MKRLIIAISALVISVVFCSCGEKINGNGNVITETRSIDKPIVRVNNCWAADIDIVLSDRNEIMITGESNIISLVQTYEKDGTLIIRQKPKTRIKWKNIKPVSITIYMDECRGIKNSGSGDIFINSPIYDRFSIENSGAGDITINDLESIRTIIQNSGFGDIYASGITETLEIYNDDSGDIDCYDLTARWVKVENNDDGDVSAYATESAEVWIRGEGSVWIDGTNYVRYHYDTHDDK